MKNNALKTRPWKATQTYPYPAEPPPAPKRSLGGKLLRALLMIFFGTWMFGLGVIVGRETVPIDLESDRLAEEFAARKAEEMAADRKQLEEGSETLQETDLDFYEELRNGSTQPPESIIPFVNPASPLEKKQIETKRPAVKKPLAAQKIETPVEPPPKPDPPSRPAPETPPNPQPEAVGAETGDFAIQVASYGNPMDAERLVDRLRSRGYPSAYQTNEEVPGVGMRFRVKVGFFPSKSSAEGVLNRLVTEENLIDAFIFHRK